jgi:SNF2 family DNA or RNA helicase
MYTPYHSKYFATQLTLKRPSNSIESLASSLSGAKVDLNPHQIDAALFAFRSPLSNGVLLADEVGLGKTIEAGIVIAQMWAERKRNILLIVPASLRNQWLSEIDEKFYIKSMIVESKNYNKMKREGKLNPFKQKDNIVICSFNFAASKVIDVANVNWDLVVIDEAVILGLN